MKCPRCGELFQDENEGYAPDVCSSCAESDDFPIEGAWRPYDPSNGKRFFRVEDDDAHWSVVARDEEHCIFRGLGAEKEGLYLSLNIDAALEHGITTIAEYSPESLARIQRCRTQDDRGVIPLADAQLGEAFCSEW
jgi:hypothetical protein